MMETIATIAIFIVFIIFIVFMFFIKEMINPSSIIDELMRTNYIKKTDSEPSSEPEVSNNPHKFPGLTLFDLSKMKKLGTRNTTKQAVRSNIYALMARLVIPVFWIVVLITILNLTETFKNNIEEPNSWPITWFGIGFGAYFMLSFFSILRHILYGNYRMLGGMNRTSAIIAMGYGLSKMTYYSMVVPILIINFWVGLLCLALFIMVEFYLLPISETLLNRPSKRQKDLLVLRVFGDENRSVLLTHWMFDCWTKFGPVFTIGSPDSWEVRNRSESMGIQLVGFLIFFSLFFALCAFPAILFVVDAFSMWYFLISIPLAFVSVYFLSLRLEVILKTRFKKLFSSNITELKTAINKAYGKSFFQRRYVSPNLFCTGNFWKEAVAHLAKESEVILIDLRGFKSSNKGTAYELQFVSDHYDLSKALLLLDTSTETDHLQQVLASCWEKVDKSSPNYNNKLTSISSYLMAGSSRSEITGLIELLLRVEENSITENLNRSVASVENQIASSDRLKKVVRLRKLGITLLSLVIIPFGISFIVSEDNGITVYGLSETAIGWIAVTVGIIGSVKMIFFTKWKM